MKHIFLTGLFVLLSLSAFAQEAGETQSINEYLESTVKYHNELMVNSSVQSVIKSDIMEAGLSVNIGDEYNDAIIYSSYFMQVDGSLLPFESIFTILSSEEFIKVMKQNKFKLRTEEDAIALQTLLCLIDDYEALGYFKEDKTWYFVRDEFFDDVIAYEITSDKKGNILSIEYHSDLKKEMPESLLAVYQKEEFGRITDEVAKADSAWAHNYLSQKADYTFIPTKIDLPIDAPDSAASVYSCDLESTEIYSDGTKGTSGYSFMLMANNGVYEKIRDAEAVLESDMFTESILKSMKINTEEDAKDFQDLIDLLNPVDKSFRFLKKFYQQDGIWFFLRATRFDDIYGYMVKTDEAGAIQYADYSAITDTDILRFKMKADDFMVDYRFELVRPATNKVTVKQGEPLSVEISFDADIINAAGCWIMMRFDGRDAGFHASTSMESPYTDEIIGEAFENPHHTVEYYLLKSGAEGIEDALAVIKLEIEVE